MSAVERLEQPSDGTANQPSASETTSSIEAAVNLSPAARQARLRPLLALAPYVARYRGRVTLAFISLTVAAITTLVSRPIEITMTAYMLSSCR